MNESTALNKRPEMKMPREAAFCFSEMSRTSDADAELGRLPVAGVRVEVVGCAPFELVALADFAAYVETERGNGHTDGEPSDDLEGLAVLLFVEERQVAGLSGHGVDALLISMIAQLWFDVSHPGEVRLQLWFDAYLVRHTFPK